jgi:hypothetical protein
MTKALRIGLRGIVAAAIVEQRGRDYEFTSNRAELL